MARSVAEAMAGSIRYSVSYPRGALSTFDLKPHSRFRRVLCILSYILTVLHATLFFSELMQPLAETHTENIPAPEVCLCSSSKGMHPKACFGPLTCSSMSAPPRQGNAKRMRIEDTLRVKKLSEHATIPSRGSAGAAGYDLSR